MSDYCPFQVFRYHWRYAETGLSGTRSVLAQTRSDALELVNHWNQQEVGWTYWLD